MGHRISPIELDYLLSPAGGGLLLFSTGKKKKTLRWITLVSLSSSSSSPSPSSFSSAWIRPGMQFVEKGPWIPEYGINYFLGIDGISLFLVLLTTFLTRGLRDCLLEGHPG